MTKAIFQPRKTHDVHNHHMDSTIWDEFAYRPGDVVIGTWAKSGTTWVQQIVGQLLLGPDPQLATTELSPWLDMRVVPRADMLGMMEAQQHRRFIKTHLPLDAITWSPDAHYIYVGRDARDVVWSLFRHHHSFSEDAYRMFNETPGRVGPPLEPPPDDIHQYWHDWLGGNGYPFWKYWENISSWWAARELPNVMLLHFNDLKADMPGKMREIASFIGAEVDADDWDRLEEYCTFAWMKANSDRVAPGANRVFSEGSKAFFHKGENRRWSDVLSDEECAEYEALAIEKLGADCARWMMRGDAG